MIKLIALLLLIVFSSSTFAEWIVLSDTDEKTVYIDTTSLRQKNGYAKIWVLGDYKINQPVNTNKDISRKVFSTKAQYEFNCQEELSRPVYISLHSGSMGFGDILDSWSEVDTWKPVPPDTLERNLLSIACKKPK